MTPQDQIVILLGPPGAGKGTQGARLSDAFGLPHVSTGDILRAEQSQPTERGLYIDTLMKAGSFASDEMMLDIIRDLLGEPGYQNGLILDGFPRTLAQAEAFDDMLASINRVRPYAVEFQLADELADERMRARARADDSPELNAKRLADYHTKTAPLLDYYDALGCLLSVDANQTPDTVFAVAVRACDRGRRKALLSTMTRDGELVS